MCDGRVSVLQEEREGGIEDRHGQEGGLLKIGSKRKSSGTSLIRISALLGTYSGICPGPSGGPTGGGRFLMSEAPL